MKATGLTGFGMFELRVARVVNLNPLSYIHAVTAWHGIIMSVLIIGLVIHLIHDKMSHHVPV